MSQNKKSSKEIEKILKSVNETSFIKNIPENLLQEAIESLNYGLQHYAEYNETHEISTIKQSIINLQRFMELTLKYNVAKINPLLLFAKSFKGEINVENEHVISYEESLNFYINNIKYSIINIDSEYKDNFKNILSSLQTLRNRIIHSFILPSETEKIDERLNKILELTYLVCLSDNTRETIEEKLEAKNRIILDDIINLEQQKFTLSMQKITKYKSKRTSSDPKEADIDKAPIFSCPSCGEEGLILSANNSVFQCAFCNDEVECRPCFFGCGKIFPENLLHSCDDDEHNMICEECKNYIERNHSDI